MECMQCKDEKFISGTQHLIYHPKLRQCILCGTSEASCEYRKTKTIYATCSGIEGGIGHGTRLDPFNIFRFSDLDWDQVIMDNENILKSVIEANELGLI